MILAYIIPALISSLSLYFLVGTLASNKCEKAAMAEYRRNYGQKTN